MILQDMRYILGGKAGRWEMIDGPGTRFGLALGHLYPFSVGHAWTAARRGAEW
jgi:hypothetical protein